MLNAKDYGIPQNRERVFTVSILGNENYEFPKENIQECEVINPLQGVSGKSWQFEQNVYSENSILRSLKAGGGSGNIPKVIEHFEFPPKQELKLKLKDMLEDEVDEKYYLSEQAIRGRMITHYQKYKLEENCINDREIHPTILARFEGAPTLYKIDNYRIRKLTPKECFRLMGFDDEDYEKTSKVNSNTQLYKQAGNSICVPVLEAILKKLLKGWC